MKYRCPKCDFDDSYIHGKFKRLSDSKTITRYKCKSCFKTFSKATFSSCYNQNKRRVNSMIQKLLSSGMSQRRIALVLNITRTTVARKLRFLALKARISHQAYIKTLTPEELKHLQFDDLITNHHTKLKPLSVSVLVSKENRKILAIDVSIIPSFGHLAKISRRKYGKRLNELKGNLDSLFSDISNILETSGTIDSDEHHLYPQIIKNYLPNWKHNQYKSKRASVAGQGELKNRGRDPIYSINHTLAMLRANINRLFRKTWNTTKDIQGLKDHIAIYIDFHNRVLTPQI